MCGPQFNLRAQVFAARGYVVLCANPRGAPGYGEAFGNLLRTGLPGDDYDDLMRGVDAALAKGYIDPQRLMVAGGLVAAWAIGHTDRFAAAVARHPIVNWFTDIATAPDGARRAADWMGAMPWDDPDQYMKRSPLFFAGNFRTPTLVLARARDPASRRVVFRPSVAPRGFRPGAPLRSGASKRTHPGVGDGARLARAMRPGNLRTTRPRPSPRRLPDAATPGNAAASPRDRSGPWANR